MGGEKTVTYNAPIGVFCVPLFGCLVEIAVSIGPCGRESPVCVPMAVCQYAKWGATSRDCLFVIPGPRAQAVSEQGPMRCFPDLFSVTLKSGDSDTRVYHFLRCTDGFPCRSQPATVFMLPNPSTAGNSKRMTARNLLHVVLIDRVLSHTHYIVEKTYAYRGMRPSRNTADAARLPPGSRISPVPAWTQRSSASFPPRYD